MSLERQQNRHAHYVKRSLTEEGKPVKQDQGLNPISPHQCGPESPVQSRDSVGPQQVSGDLCGRHSYDLRRRGGVVRTAKNSTGPRYLQSRYHTRHHPLLGR